MGVTAKQVAMHLDQLKAGKSVAVSDGTSKLSKLNGVHRQISSGWNNLIEEAPIPENGFDELNKLWREWEKKPASDENDYKQDFIEQYLQKQDEPPIMLPKIPPLPEPQEWDEENPPFKDLSEYSMTALLEVCRSFESGPVTTLTVPAPIKMEHGGHFENLSGLEEYELIAVRVVGDQLRFWLKAKSPMKIQYINDVQSSFIQRVFGGELLDLVEDRTFEVSKQTKWARARQVIEARETAERFKDTGMTFGEW